jgi:hypothetical protein
MKRMFFAAALSIALCSGPAIAQQGPAGVPGAFGFAKSVTVPLVAPPPQEKQPEQVPRDCAKAKDVERCKARQEAQAKALKACKGKAGAELKQCLDEQKQAIDCKKSSDPLRCEQHKKAHALCKDKLGSEHRQCLRDNLTTKK